MCCSDKKDNKRLAPLVLNCGVYITREKQLGPRGAVTNQLPSKRDLVLSSNDEQGTITSEIYIYYDSDGVSCEVAWPVYYYDEHGHLTWTWEFYLGTAGVNHGIRYCNARGQRWTAED